MQNIRFALDGAWQVLAIGLLFGAGLPALFALGVRSLALGVGGAAEADPSASPHPVGRVVGGACFAVVALVAVLGIAFIVASGFGMSLSFEHVYPTFVAK